MSRGFGGSLDGVVPATGDLIFLVRQTTHPLGPSCVDMASRHRKAAGLSRQVCNAPVVYIVGVCGVTRAIGPVGRPLPFRGGAAVADAPGDRQTSAGRRLDVCSGANPDSPPRGAPTRSRTPPLARQGADRRSVRPRRSAPRCVRRSRTRNIELTGTTSWKEKGAGPQSSVGLGSYSIRIWGIPR